MPSTGTADPDCLFCRIVAGDIPADVVAQSETAVAFRDLNPQAPTHALVVPRSHHADAASLADAEPETVAELVARRPRRGRRPMVWTSTGSCSTPARPRVRLSSTPTCTCSPEGR